MTTSPQERPNTVHLLNVVADLVTDLEYLRNSMEALGDRQSVENVESASHCVAAVHRELIARREREVYKETRQ